MYVPQEEITRETLFQGDVIDGFPVFIFKTPLTQVARTTEGGTTFEIQQGAMNDSSLLLTESKLGRVMILSQTCDIEHRENIIVAPVYEIEALKDQGVLNTDTIKNIKKRKVYYWFYLPSYGGIINDSIADFQGMFYLPKEHVIQYVTSKIVTINDLGRHHLGWALSNFFGRPVDESA